MGKILGSWSGMRKYLEQEMSADSLKGRIRYNCTTYIGMDDCHVFEIFIDGKLFKQFSWETVNTYFINNGLTQNKNPYGKNEYWAEFQSLLNRYPPNLREEYTDGEFCNALETYRNTDIHECIHSENPLVRMFAVLDRRVGKRTLAQLKQSINEQPRWLQQIYLLRFSVDSI